MHTGEAPAVGLHTLLTNGWQGAGAGPGAQGEAVTPGWHLGRQAKFGGLMHADEVLGSWPTP
jgi:hypothetical protein